MPSLTETILRSAALSRGASACGFVGAGALAEHGRFLASCAGAPPDLAYLARRSPERADIRLWFPEARTVLMCAFSYWDRTGDYAAALAAAGEPLGYLTKAGHRPKAEFIAAVSKLGLRPRIARYALTEDYHTAVAGRLKLILEDIRAICPSVEGRAFVDTAPVLEKELGRLAGLGFRGKNTLLVSEEAGSYFFLGGLALSGEIPVPSPAVAEDGCGSCRRCIDACPTGALKEHGAMDAGLCISYWNTQSKTAAPETIISRSGGFVYGCDLCQEVCPYNGGKE